MEKKKKKIKAHRIGTCGTFCSNCNKSDARAFNQYIKYCWFCGAEFNIKNWWFLLFIFLVGTLEKWSHWNIIYLIRNFDHNIVVKGIGGNIWLIQKLLVIATA